MLAVMYGHQNVVNLLKNKYGQQEPAPEEIVSCHDQYIIIVFNCTYIATI